MKVTKKVISIILSMALIISGISVNVYQSNADDEDTVIEISSADELTKIGNDEAYPLDGSYKLVNDIENVTTTIGDSTTPFTGKFDGEGHSITFHITDAPNYTGLFGYVNGAVIKNVIAKGTMDVQYGWTAGIAAKAENSTITSCGSEVKIVSAGSNSTCFSGIAGYAKNTTITDCYNSGSISGKIKNAGGIAGQTNTSVDIENCYNTGEISTTATSSQRVGGVVGYGQVSTGQSGKIYNCYNSGLVTGSGQTGAFIGYIYTGFEAKNCYYLEGTHENAFGFQYEADTSDINAVSEEELIGLSDVLGENYAVDSNLNNGYPVLTWQIKEPDTSVEDTATLEAVAAKLSTTIRPNFYSDKNIITYVEEKIAAMDEAKDVQIKVSLESAVPRKENAPASIDSDGTIHYVYMDLFNTEAMTINNNKITWVDVTFTLTLNKSSVEYKPAVALRWDLDEVKKEMQKVADNYATDSIVLENASLEEVVSNLQLPYYPIMSTDDGTDTIKWVKVTYTSSNPEVLTISETPDWDSDYSNQYYTVTVNRPEEDTNVTITATIEFDRYDETYGEEKIKEPVTKEIEVTVLADTEKVEQKKLQESVNNYENYLSDFNAKEPLDVNAVKNDIQLAIPKDLGIDGKYYDITVESSNPSIVEIYGYRTFTYRPLPGEAPEDVILTVTVTKKDNPNVTATTKITLTVLPLTEQEIDDALAFMEEAKENFFDFIKNENTDKEHIVSDLKTFYGIYADENGNLYASDYVDKPNNSGILTTIVNPEEIVPDNKRYWISSDTDIIENQALRVTQPEYNKNVVVGAIITHEVFEKYADRYAEDEVYGEKFAELKNQTVTCELTVVGTKGEEPIFETGTTEGAATEISTTEEVATSSGAPVETTARINVNESTTATEVTTKAETTTDGAKANVSKIKKSLKITKLKCKKAKKKVKLTWKRNKQASGYVVKYRKGSKKKYVKKILKTNKKHSLKIKRYKKLIVKIRAYKVVNGKKIYGVWKKRKIK